MKHDSRFNVMVAGICLAALAGTVHADDAALNFELPSAASFYVKNSQSIRSRSYLLALNEEDAAKQQKPIGISPAAEVEPPMFSSSNIHKYLGLGTLALAVATAIAPKPAEVKGREPTPAEKDEQDSSTHAMLGKAAAAMAAATVTTGLLAHWDDFHLEDGLLDPDNLHAMLGTAGALAILYAVSQAPDAQHAGTGVAGGVAMGIAIKLTW